MKPNRPSKARPPVRVRYDPPTIDEAIFAAQGLTEDLEEQIEIAASLMDVTADDVRPRLAALKRPRMTIERQIIPQQRNGGYARAVVVERKPARRFIRAG